MDDWYIQPAAYAGNPLQNGALADIGSGVDRVARVAGMGAPVVLSGVSRFGGNLQWGTKSTIDPKYPTASANTAYTASPSSVQSSASVHLKFRDNADGTQEYAMGRIVKHPGGALRFCQFADDAPVGSCPRVQWYLSPLMNLRQYRFVLDVQFGDDVTPFPAYVAGKDSVLFFQLKGTASQPVISAVAMYDSPTSDKLTVQFNVKRSNTGSTITIAERKGIAKGARVRFDVEGLLTWSDSGYWKVYCADLLIGSMFGNTLMADFADSVQPAFGIYRYGHYGAKAPDDCAIIFNNAGVGVIETS